MELSVDVSLFSVFVYSRRDLVSCQNGLTIVNLFITFLKLLNNVHLNAKVNVFHFPREFSFITSPNLRNNPK